VFTADINGDGNPDFLLKAVPSVVMLDLDEDISFPVVTNALSRSFVIMSVRDDPGLAIAGMNNSTVDYNPSANLINSPLAAGRL
jgi:hypothetical protein